MLDQQRQNTPVVADSKLTAEAQRLGHPNPENADQFELNVLSGVSFRMGRAPSPEEAKRILHIAEFDRYF